jgi:hypothetical protein
MGFSFRIAQWIETFLRVAYLPGFRLAMQA